MSRVPFGEPSEPQEFVSRTSDGRMACEVCGEWIYTQRRVENDVPGHAAYPPECQVCGALVPESHA